MLARILCRLIIAPCLIFVDADLLNCSQKYCIDQTFSGITVTINPNYEGGATETGLMFPDNDFYVLLRSKNLHENQINKLEFGLHCNVNFNNELLNSNPIQMLESLRFDKICWLNSVKYGYCLNVPEEWRQKIQLVNNRFCINAQTEMAPDFLDEISMLYDQLDESKEHVNLLNNSLNRALHLYKEAELSNKQAQIQLNKAERDNAVCNTNLNRTVNLTRLRNRQIIKCAGQLERLQQLRIDKFKNALDELYGNFLNLMNNL